MLDSCQNTEDNVLWLNLKSGNKSGFNQLFRKYYSELYYYGMKIDSNPDLVKDSVQDVFVRIWETRENLSEVKNIKSYLIVSVRRMILSQKKKSLNFQGYEIDDLEQNAFHFDLNEFEKHKEIPDDVRSLLLESINALTKKQRELIQLFFYHELTYPEISQILGISIQATRNLMYRTLTHLREILGKSSIDAIKNMIFFFFSSVEMKKLEKT